MSPRCDPTIQGGDALPEHTAGRKAEVISGDVLPEHTSGRKAEVFSGDVLPEHTAERLAEVFSGHVAAGEGGMAFCLYRAGQPVLRLYGGSTGTGHPWGRDTLAVLFSGTKGLVATVAAILIDRGLLDPHAPVAQYWPEFAAGGKAEVRVHHVLSHTAGLLYVEPAAETEAAWLDNTLMAERLAAQPTLWEPGTKVGYHAITFGYLSSELLRRVSGHTTGGLIHRELGAAFDLDVYLGLPASEEARVAPVHRAPNYGTPPLADPEHRAILDRMYGSILFGEDLPFNTREYHAAELAAGGGLGTADAMARLYSLLVSPAAPVVSEETLALCTRTWSEGLDVVTGRPVRFGLGYELDDPIGTYGPNRPAFGHSGAGGGVHGAWAQHGLGFSFLTNEMHSEDVDRRAKDLLAVLGDLPFDAGSRRG